MGLRFNSSELCSELRRARDATSTVKSQKLSDEIRFFSDRIFEGDHVKGLLSWIQNRTIIESGVWELETEFLVLIELPLNSDDLPCPSTNSKKTSFV